MPSPEPYIIIGAGVLGLSVAHTLLTSSPTPPQILLLASQLPTDPNPSPSYASPWAGAHYRPIPATTPQLAYEAGLATRTAATMLRLADEVGAGTCGVGRVRGREEFERREAWMEREGEVVKRAEMVGYAFPGDGFRVLAAEKGELPMGVVWGCEYETYCVNTPLYLRWLMRECQGRGMRVVQREVKDLGEVWGLAAGLGFRGARTVVDCSGVGVERDGKVEIIRGQTVVVRKQLGMTVTRQGREGWWSFLIPRPGGGGTVVGGTKEVGDWDGGVREETRESLLRRARECFPDFFEGEDAVEATTVVRDIVGRRPWRDGGLRIEGKDLGQKGRRVVYGYGAGGRGYELSWAVADKVVKLIREGWSLYASL